MQNRISRLIDLFRREDGNVTVEAVLWVPFFVVCLTLITDAALIFYGQARATQVAQDGNRAYAVGDLATADDTQTYIAGRLAQLSPNATVRTFRDKGLITTVVTVPTGDLDAVGLFTSLKSIDMQVVAQMVQEF